MDIPTLITELGSTPSATARATGLSRMTVQRVRDGVSSPSLGTLREFALAAGFDLDVRLVPASDPAAAIAARVLLDPTLQSLEAAEASGNSNPDDHQAIIEWVERLQRHRDTSPRSLLARAGTYAAPQHRPGARHFRPKPGLTQQHLFDIAASATAARSTEHTRVALSGMPAALTYLGAAPHPGPIIIWARNTDTDTNTNVDTVADRLSTTLHEAESYQPGGILVAPTMQATFIDAFEQAATRTPLVSPIQAALDLHGLGYAELANQITEGW